MDLSEKSLGALTQGEWKAVGRTYLADVEMTAVHEAGHAVAVIDLLGWVPTFISVDLVDGKVRFAESGQLRISDLSADERRRYQVMLLAGPAAGRRYRSTTKAAAGEAKYWPDRRIGQMERVDQSNLQRSLREGDSRDEIETQAAAYVKAKWRIIREVGDFLFRRTLGERPASKEELQQIIRRVGKQTGRSAALK